MIKISKNNSKQIDEISKKLSSVFEEQKRQWKEINQLNMDTVEHINATLKMLMEAVEKRKEYEKATKELGEKIVEYIVELEKLKENPNMDTIKTWESKAE